MRVVKGILMVMLIMLLVGCNQTQENKFENAINSFIENNHFGYDLSITQTKESQITNSVEIEKRIHRGDVLKSYISIKQKQLILFSEKQYQQENKYYYFSENQLIIEDNNSFETKPITFEEYLDIDERPPIQIDFEAFQSYIISESPKKNLEAKIDPENIKKILSDISGNIVEGFFTLTLNEDNKIEQLKIDIHMELTKITILITPVYTNSDVIIPNIE